MPAVVRHMVAGTLLWVPSGLRRAQSMRPCGVWESLTCVHVILSKVEGWIKSIDVFFCAIASRIWATDEAVGAWKSGFKIAA